MSFCLIILAGGNSHRFRSKVGKPYQKLAGKSLIELNVIKARKFKQIKKNVKKNEIVSPGHIFPIIAKDGGVLVLSLIHI